MAEVMSILGTLVDLALVLAGFGAIIFVHELGHYLAARWAGIRVLAFALGFGGAVATYRRGLGFRRGTSEPEFAARVRAGEGAGISPTEYRLNVLPLGGYVKMLGQEDLNPGAVSSDPDSYQNCPPWKRMVVISAGVVMNVAAAAVLYVIVFTAGLRTEPASIGLVLEDGAASRADAEGDRVMPGDRVVRVNGRAARSFNDIVLAGAMARRGRTVELVVEREEDDGSTREVSVSVAPTVSKETNLLDLGVVPAFSATIITPDSEREREVLWGRLAAVPGLAPGFTLVRVGDNARVSGAHELIAAMERGEPVEVEFIPPLDQARPKALGTLTPLPRLDTAVCTIEEGTASGKVAVEHAMGLVPVLRVEGVEARAEAMGLRAGDVFARLGSLEFPSLAGGIAEIRRHAGETIPAVVLREEGGATREVTLDLHVERRTRAVGFTPGDTSEVSALLADAARVLERADEEVVAPGARVLSRAGARIVRVDGRPVETLLDVRVALADAARGAGEGVRVALTVAWARTEAAGTSWADEEEVALDLSPEEAEHARSIGWRSPIPLGAFEIREDVLRADGPLDAISMGLGETHRVMLLTYATFARLFEGTVKVEHLKGPVGIAHVGTRLASKGPVWLLFFLALISINLAVINFLPMPIVDGGQFVLLVIEQVRGRPVPVAIQNMATLVGMVLIGSLFLFVTFQDLRGIFAG